MTSTLRESLDAADPLRTGSRLLSGSPVLLRGEPVVAACDPLGLGAHAAKRWLERAAQVTQGDHALPQRQAFGLPVCVHAGRPGESKRD